MNFIDSVSVDVINQWIECAERLGVNRKILLENLNIDPSELTDKSNRFKLTDLQSLRDYITIFSTDPSTGFELGKITTYKMLGIFGYLLANSKDVDCALGHLKQYLLVLSNRFSVNYYKANEYCQLEIEISVKLPNPEQLIEQIITSIVAIFRSLTDDKFNPSQVEFVHDPINDPATYIKYFGCDVGFGRDKNAITCLQDVLASPISDADHELLLYLEPLAQGILKTTIITGGFSKEVIEIINGYLMRGVKVSINSVACALNISTRSLQRNLQLENVSFRDLIETQREKLALSLINDKTMDILDIAILLGYSEPSGFYRAFKRWTGKSLREYRR